MSVVSTARLPLPRSIWVLAAAMVIFFTARGMTVPFFIIYFGQIRGFGESSAGAGVTINAFAGVVFTLMMAGLIDRIGARPMLVLTIFGVGLMTAALPFVDSVLTYFFAMALYGLAAQLFWPASDGLATSLISMHQAAQMFALLRVTNAIGIGAGGLIGGALVSGGGTAEYQFMYVVAGVACGVAALIVIALIHPTHKVPEQDSSFHDFSQSAGWWDVLADRRFLFSQLVIFVLVAGFMQLQVAMPPYLRSEAGISESFNGGLFAFKTVLLVIFQMPVAGRISHWQRGITLALSGLTWMIAYTLIGLSSWLFVLPIIAVAIFVIGEMLFMPTSGVIVVDLAPERLRGRYLALNSVAWGAGWGISSLIAGFLLSSTYPFIVWPIVIFWIALGVLGGWWYDRGAPDRYGGVAPATTIGGSTNERHEQQKGSE